MRKAVLVAATAILAVAMLGSMGCRRVRLTDAQTGRSLGVSTETTRVALGAAEELDATIRMGVGLLKLRAGEPSSTTALDGTFDFAPAEWEPEVTYSVEGTRGVLYVGQPDVGVGPSFGRSENTWTLEVAPGVPTSLSLKLGVGESDVDLRGIDLTDLEVITGVGEATIDLSGERTEDLTARIEAGVGEVTVSVPSDVGVRIIGGEDGLGELDADGFRAERGDLTNAAWSGTGPKIELRVTRGIGTMRIESVD